VPDRFALDRAAFEDLLFGGRHALRFTQDSPVLPEVWIELAKPPGGRVELLLTPHYDAHPADLARVLRDGLKGLVAEARLAYTGTYVAAALTLEELVTLVLPGSRGWVPTEPWPSALLGAVLALRDADGGTPVVTLEDLQRRGRAFVAEHPEQVAAGDQVWQVSLNRPAFVAVSESRRTIKADAVGRLFEIECGALAWAVIDTGVDARHLAFRTRDKTGKPARSQFTTRVTATYDLTRLRAAQTAAFSGTPPADPATAKLAAEHADLLDAMAEDISAQRPLDWKAIEPLLRVPHGRGYEVPVRDHGTHVAGILAADWPEAPDGPLRGICPDLKLFDLRVFDRDGRADEFAVHAALQFIDHLNGFGRRTLVHGANVSMSLHHRVKSFACGQTPVCREANRLVASGAVVVVAAGNQGRAEYGDGDEGYRSISITDPGNADDVITVGATHRANPHTYGVSYFSSRGPTGDGRPKPDLVAPGEKITAPVTGGGSGEKDGTSQAAPHVSGAAALLLARHRELIGNPSRVKRILCSTATDLGRERSFQGAGLVDVLRALQEL
jgi:serine protease AprX